MTTTNRIRTLRTVYSASVNARNAFHSEISFQCMNALNAINGSHPGEREDQIDEIHRIVVKLRAKMSQEADWAAFALQAVSACLASRWIERDVTARLEYIGA